MTPFWFGVTWLTGGAVGYLVRSMVQAWRDDRFTREYRERHPEEWRA